MTEIHLEEFYEAYAKALANGDAALFAGAGLSQPAGFANWKELMREIAQDLGLDVDKEIGDRSHPEPVMQQERSIFV